RRVHAHGMRAPRDAMDAGLGNAYRSPRKPAPEKDMIRKLHHNAYRCRDSEETRRFYEDFLGLPLVHTIDIGRTKTGRETRAPHGYVIELCAKRADHDAQMDPAANGARAALERWSAEKAAAVEHA